MSYPIWLEQYKQINDDIRNYHSIHWNIASVLYLLMGFIIGYGVPNVADVWGKGIVCFSTFLIFTLHVTTFYYFRKLEKIKRGKLKEIMTKIETINQDKNCFLEDKHIPMSCFWQSHPKWILYHFYINVSFGSGVMEFPKKSSK